IEERSRADKQNLPHEWLDDVEASSTVDRRGTSADSAPGGPSSKANTGKTLCQLGSINRRYRERGPVLRILVADDHDIVRRGLKQLLTAQSGWTVVAEAKNGREAVALAEQHKPDVVVMDISMPELNGLEAARRVRKLLPKTQIVILTLHFSDQLVHDIV